MYIFTDYMQPLTVWLQVHPQLALLFTFLISFTESLAVIGSIIPGSVTMTAIGILAGSGIMRIDLTFLAATLGAIAGDTGSYTLGYTFSDRLSNIWPFKRYPTWLEYGKDFFYRYGSTSVLVGRFVGPMRSIIPVIAGMMHMNRWHFLVANIISAVGWALLYVLPGVLIGLASSELSAESATHLFVIILTILVVIWLTSLGIKWLLKYAGKFLRPNLHFFWMRLKQNIILEKYIKDLAPRDETNHYPTAALMILLVFCFFMSIITISFVLQGSWAADVNNAIYLFLQSIRTQHFDAFFIIISLIISPLSLLTLMFAFSFYTLYYKDWRTLGYWISLCIITIAVILLIEPNRQLLYHTASFPAISLTLATSLFTFLAFYINSYHRTIPMRILRIALIIILFLAGLSSIYLGDKWLTSIFASFFIGLTICLLHWIFYRRQKKQYPRSQLPIALSCLFLGLATCFSTLLYFKEIVRSHSPHLKQYVMTDDVWWNQQRLLLPLYSTNRIGKRIGLLNIQYAGSIDKLVQSLEESGWKTQSNSFFYSLLLRAGGHKSSGEVPLVAEIYLNKKPALMMTYPLHNDQPPLVLRLWRSNYHLRHYQDPIWIGSVAPRLPKYAKSQMHQTIDVLRYIINSLPEFRFNKIKLPKRYLTPLANPASQTLLTIKEPTSKEIKEKKGNNSK